MLTKRIVPCLDVTGGRVGQGPSSLNLRDAGQRGGHATYAQGRVGQGEREHRGSAGSRADSTRGGEVWQPMHRRSYRRETEGSDSTRRTVVLGSVHARG